MTPTLDPPIIDAHVLLGREHPHALETSELIRRMDAAGIALALARPMGAELVVDNRAGNRRVLSAGPRVRGLVTVNPWFGSAALDELRRSRDEGAVGLFLHPARQGFSPFEPVAAPVLELAASFRWPIVIHTGTYIYADVLAVGEVARRMPQANFILGWAGFTDMWFELPGVAAEVPNIYFDTSMIWSTAISAIVESLGPTRALFAGGEPRNRYAVNLRSLGRLDLAPAARRAILHDNAVRLFNLTPPKSVPVPPLALFGPPADASTGGKR
ncbi:MAG: amidohydrolase family protein [Planctomycetota bacterium]|nr:amidohydrolase family protein [Planctomycetota bacterium]